MNAPDTSPDPMCTETHISWVLLTGERAFKIYKPIVTDVLDHSDLDRRRAGCEEEVRLNSRLAPDVYHGVGSIELDGASLEPVIVMSRMPASRRLSALLDTAQASDLLREVAGAVAAFHSTAEVLPEPAAQQVASATAVRRRWSEDLIGVRGLSGPDEMELLSELEHRALTYMDGRDALFVDRINHGMIRDGHGDLLADDIFCLPDGPRILDCLAFSDELRSTDVIADLAFLVMDIQRLGHPRLSREILVSYSEFSGEHHPASLTHVYVAHRALVRAKVSALRRHQSDNAVDDVGDLLQLALEHLRRCEVRAVLVGGLPGSGKSTTARRIAEDLHWPVLSSDGIRRDLGLRSTDLGDDSAYDPTNVAKVYEEMREQASLLLQSGTSVILDATWGSIDERQRTRAMAASTATRVIEFRCDAPASLCRSRVGSRTDPSDSEATAEVVDLFETRADAWPEASVVDTSGATSVSDARPWATESGTW